MASSHTHSGNEQFQTSQITLRVWHPDCWTLQTTEHTDAGLIAHGVYEHDGIVSGRFTAYADTTAAIDELAEAIEGSPLTGEVKRINEYFNPTLRTDAAGNATQELLVEYEPNNSIHNAFVSRGFVPEEEIRIHDGYEYWTVIVAESRPTIQQRLDEVREEMNAEITVEGMKSGQTDSTHRSQSRQLSERQREVFELAKREGYYTWPRETSASALAEKLGISKTTLLEHLRKAESKILGQQE
ncbi:MAG: helix-turn-helix domain-containing protein [Halolamina sp.]